MTTVEHFKIMSLSRFFFLEFFISDIFVSVEGNKQTHFSAYQRGGLKVTP